MIIKEPDFMKELHKIREKLSKEWKRKSDKEFLTHMHKIGRKFKHLETAKKAA